MKKAYRDGTTHIVPERLDFIARLAAFVSPLWMHLTRFHGVFAAHARLRAAITPAGTRAGRSIADSDLVSRVFQLLPGRIHRERHRVRDLTSTCAVNGTLTGVDTNGVNIGYSLATSLNIPFTFTVTGISCGCSAVPASIASRSTEAP